MRARHLAPEVARRWLGVPFRHQGRNRTGLDCVGLVIMVAKELGISDFDIVEYGQQPDPKRMGELLRANLDPISFSKIEPGDILWLRIVNDPQHLAIVTQVAPRAQMIHALRRPGFGRVVEHGLDAHWRHRIAGCFRYRD